MFELFDLDLEVPDYVDLVKFEFFYTLATPKLGAKGGVAKKPGAGTPNTYQGTFAEKCMTRNKNRL